jgi:hypothetical protein
MGKRKRARTFVMPIPEHVSLWMTPIEIEKIERRFFHFPFWFVLTVVTGALVILSVLLWSVTSSGEAVAKLFVTDMLHDYFPATKRSSAHLARKHGDTWAIFLPAMLGVNMAISAFTAACFSVWMAAYPFAIDNRHRRNSELIASTCAATTKAILWLLVLIAIFVFLVSLGLFVEGNTSRDLRESPRRSIGMYIVLQHLFMMALPSAFVMMVFLFKFLITLKRLDSRRSTQRSRRAR